jgi:ribonucleoside-diphosphate reductase alpha chain
MKINNEIRDNVFKKIEETYNSMSEFYYIHATPTLFNYGTRYQQGSSCFLLGISDSIDGIYDCLKNSAKISQHSGGIGVHISNIRANGSLIKTICGTSSGTAKMLKMFDDSSSFIDQGGKRKGAIAVYIAIWHADILELLKAKDPKMNNETGLKNLFFALMINDLFMQRCIDGTLWSLMSPDECPLLVDAYGTDFEEKYTNYEKEGKFRMQINANELLSIIIRTRAISGTPYMLFSDTINNKSNQKNVGPIKSSNLCAEIVEYSDSNSYAVCNLASISLPKFVKKHTGLLDQTKILSLEELDNIFDFPLLGTKTEDLCVNLNKIIDNNYYPTEECVSNNIDLRPIGIGIQGLADVFIKLKISFDSVLAKQIVFYISETMYYFALSQSN